MGKVALLTVTLLLFGGCVASRPLVLPEFKHIETDSYYLGEEQQKTVGETMVEHVSATVAVRDGFRSFNSYQVPSYLGVNYPLIPANTLFAVTSKLENGDFILQSSEIKKPTTFMGEQVSWDYCIVANSAGEPYGDTSCSGIGGGMVRKWSPKPANFLNKSDIYDNQPGSFKRELVYNGKSKDTIKIQYREYKDNFARAAFFQDLVYDMTESNNVGFRGMNIEVLEATNSYIKFIVKSEMN
jgi:hypothetical protein